MPISCIIFKINKLFTHIIDEGFQGKPPNINSFIMATKVNESGIKIIFKFIFLIIALRNPIIITFNEANTLDNKNTIIKPSRV